MNWQKIKVSSDGTHFTLEGEKLFERDFIEVLKFHAPGIAPVKDESGSYHIGTNGLPLYGSRYERAFGYYCNRAAVISAEGWFHINEKGMQIYNVKFVWTGNFQEDKCSVRDRNGDYYHIDLNGDKIYDEAYSYVGDFKDGFACVRLFNGFCKHIDHAGIPINEKLFRDLGVFHKNYATAQDEHGWFHIDKSGNGLYPERYLVVEPFYNGFALVTKLSGHKIVIDEIGNIVHKISNTI